MKKLATTLAIAALAFAGSTALHAEHHGEKADKNIVEIAAGLDDFSTLVAAVTAAELVETLAGEGPFTVFAPTNAAFEALPEGTVETLLKPENKEKLTSILLAHVVPAKVMAADVKTMTAETAGGTEIEVVAGDDGVTFGGANVVKTDVVATNGVIHVIDAVVVPE